MFRIIDNNFFNILTLFVILIFSILLVALIINFISKSIPFIRNSVKLIFDYFFIVLLIVGGLYLVSYHSSTIDGEISDSFFVSKKYASILATLSYILFSTGAVSATFKFVSSLTIFKKQFKKMIISDDFKDVISEKLEVFAYSPEMIDKIGEEQRNKLWKDVTLSKYRNNFPAIYDKLEYNLHNELFIKANTSFYYKHFHVNYDIELNEDDNNFVDIIYKTIYTIVRNSVDEFNWSFSKKLNKYDYENGFSDINVIIEDDDDGIVFEKDKLRPQEKGDDIIINFEHNLKGKTEYHIEKVHKYKQCLNNDRVLAFGSNRIIDDLIINVKYCENLSIFFSSSNKNIYKPLSDKENEFSYENRKLLLPGDKFKLFIIKKDNKN